MYIYKRTEPNLWTVLTYDSNNVCCTDSDYTNREDAARRTAWLNGSSNDPKLINILHSIIDDLYSLSICNGNRTEFSEELQYQISQWKNTLDSYQ